MRRKTNRRRRGHKSQALKNVVQNDIKEPKTTQDKEDVEIDYITEPLLWMSIPEFKESAEAFSNFRISGDDGNEANGNDSALGTGSQDNNLGDDEDQDGKSDLEDQQEYENRHFPSLKKIRRLNRPTVAQLKSVTEKPEVVEWVDVTAPDPEFLVYLKSYRNTVPVPVHWCQKRKYLQGKRGIEKTPFELPDFIKATGIMEIRSAVREKENSMKLKSKARERLQPKMGKLDMDYQKLHNAFFRWQTKPNMTIHGDLYYEGKESEAKLRTNKPGKLSDELCNALGMPPLAPPPWLINMQRYGPPPSYPQLKIPGLNAPIPAGASWGYHPGGWGKPPVDEYGRPLYGDVFGTMVDEIPSEHVAPMEKYTWGEFEENEEESEQESDTFENEVQMDSTMGIDSQIVAETPDTYADTPGGISSVPMELEIPESIELRKNAKKWSQDEPKRLYTVIREKQVPSKGFLGPQHAYDIAGSQNTSKNKEQSQDSSSNPDEEQDGTESTIAKKKHRNIFDVSKKKPSNDDSSDSTKEDSSKQEKRRSKKDDKKSSSEKKGYKGFKF